MQRTESQWPVVEVKLSSVNGPESSFPVSLPIDFYFYNSLDNRLSRDIRLTEYGLLCHIPTGVCKAESLVHIALTQLNSTQWNMVKTAEDGTHADVSDGLSDVIVREPVV